MKIRAAIGGVLATTTLAVAAAAALTALAPAAALAVGDQETPMCGGRKDPNVVVIAHANGRSEPKVILNLSTDALGVPSGSLVVGRGPERLVVTDWCRVWQHTAGAEPKCGEPYPEDAITAHAVGTTVLEDGTRILVRVDVRESDDGPSYRVRHRPLGLHEETSTAEGEGCEDETWTWVPAEDVWGTLDQLRVGTAG